MNLSDYLNKLNPFKKASPGVKLPGPGQDKTIGQESEYVPTYLRRAHRGSGGEELGTEDTKDFIEGNLLIVFSSHVKEAQYIPDTRSMVIRYKRGDRWIYGNISVEEAIDFAAAPSKGYWVHTYIRDKKRGHKKPAKQLG